MKSRSLVASAIILCLAVTAYGQNDLRNFNFDFSSSGARSEGMGRTSIGLSDDIAGGSSNPAGLYMHDLPKLGMSYSLLSPRGTTEITALSTSGIDHSGTFKTISSLNFLTPVRIKGHKFVGSVNYFRSYDEFQSIFLKLQYPAGDTVFSNYGGLIMFNDDTANYVTNTQFDRMQGGLDVFNVGFGTRLMGDLSFGLMANIYTGKIQRQGYGTDSISGVYTNVIAPNQPAEYVYRVDLTDTLKFSGINFTIGLKYNKERFTAGLLIRTPLSLGVNTERTLIGTLHVNGQERTDYRFSMLSPKINPPLSKYELPLMVGAGGSYKVTENLMVAADVEIRTFSSTTVKLRDSLLIGASGNNTEYFTEYDVSEVDSMKWQDAVVFRLGGEYMKETGIGTVPIRAGLGYVPVPPANLTTTDSVTYSASTTAGIDLALGSGLHWEQIKLDIAYTYSMRDREAVFVDYKYKNHHISFSFTGIF